MSADQIVGGGDGEAGAAAAAAGIGVDGVTAYSSDYDQSTIAGLLFGQHQTINILFVIPEAVASINTSNAVILLELQKHGHVDTIVQTDALNYPDFPQYNMIVVGSNISVAWTTSNLAHVKEYAESVLCVDEDAAAFLEMGAVGGDAAAKTVLTAITQIEANDLGLGHGTTVGLAAGANTVSAATIYNTIDMSDADITETFFGTENTADNTDVLLAAIFKRQPDGTRGLLKDGFEATGTRWFYGCAYSAVDLNTLGLAVIELIIHMAVQASTLSALEISGDIGDLETKIFGNQANEFNNGNPLVEFMAGRNSTGTRLPIGKSIYDLFGAYVDAGGGIGTDNLAADLLLIHNLVDSAETAGPLSYTGGELDVIEDTTTTRRRITAEIDLINMTKDGTIRVYRKVDGTNYRLYSEVTFLVGGTIKAFDVSFTTNQAWKITYEEAVDEGSNRSIPFNTLTEVLE